ncbi:MAG: PIN domain-containing protein [Saccharofermentans sp.]|nr:PIN domain-containing protein [Saccharofermentans sp.]
MRVLIDTNILIDAAICRLPFCKDAQTIIKLCGEGKIDGFVAFHSLSNLFCILRKEFSCEERVKMISRFRTNMQIVVITNEMIDRALDNNSIKDLEDALQYVCAEEMNVDYIVTRDLKGYSGMPIKTVTAEQLLHLLESP